MKWFMLLVYRKLGAKLDSAATWNEPHEAATPHKLYSSSSTGTQTSAGSNSEYITMGL
jgi:hypothetical protein